MIRVLGLALTIGASAMFVSTSAAGAAGTPAVQRSNDEIAVLAVAETFGYAWSHRDAKIGLAVSDFGESEGSPAPETSRAFFVGTSSPHHAAFAIERLKRVNATSYACTMTLYVYAVVAHDRGAYDAQTTTIRLDKSNGVWKVTGVPGLAGS